MFDYLNLSLLLVTFVGGLAVGFTGGIIIQTAYGAQNTTVSVPVPIMVPTLQYSPTPAITPQVSQQTAPQNNANTDIIGFVVTAMGILIAKFHSDKRASDKDKENKSAILEDKYALNEVARLLFQFNPDKANAVNDAPAVKLETLSNNTKEFADKAAKA